MILDNNIEQYLMKGTIMNWYKWKQGNLAYAPDCLVNTTEDKKESAISMDDEDGHWVLIANGLYALENPKE